MTAGSDAHFSNEVGKGGIVAENDNIFEAISKNQITVFGERSYLVNHILTKTSDYLDKTCFIHSVNILP